MKQKPIRVVELFAGVGGFRIALEGDPKKKSSKYEVVWSNQYEPRTNKQHANMVYKNRWPNTNHSEEDIEEVVANNFETIPDHDLLVGGFPCQDYSVANRTHNHGVEGKKGRLWWAIVSLIKKKGRKAPKYLLLENVDHLLHSPKTQKGRDFSVILSSLNELGYAIEWRVVNAAQYGFPQRRRRIYILAYRRNTALYKKLKKIKPTEWLCRKGIMAKAFPVTSRSDLVEGELYNTVDDNLKSFSSLDNPFLNAGIFINGKYYTQKVESAYTSHYQTLGDILLPINDIPESYFIEEKQIPKWKYVRSAKTIERISKRTRLPYLYREGNVPFPDSLNKASRTIITKEGGTYVSREKHIVFQEGRYRRLHPIELERLNGFPDNFTQCEGITDIQRAFFMGNALVIGVVKKIAKTLAKQILNSNKKISWKK